MDRTDDQTRPPVGDPSPTDVSPDTASPRTGTSASPHPETSADPHPETSAGPHPATSADPRAEASVRLSVGATAWLGVRRCLPLTLGVVPFGIAFGAAATEQGLTTLGAVSMSVVVFAGASQLAVLELLRADAPLMILVLVAVFINLRLALYGGSLAGHFTTRATPVRALMAYLITDQIFALSVVRFEEPGGRRHRIAFFLGGALTIWLAWQVGTLVGAVLGARAPGELSIDFVAPLVFIALAVPAMRDRADLAAALAAVLTFVLLHGLPYGLPLILAVVVGLTVGTVTGAKIP